MIDEKRLIKAIENQDISAIIAESPKMYKFLKTTKEKQLFIDGYHYALRDFRIIIQKLVESVERNEAESK